MACSCLKVILGWSCVAQSDTGVPALIGSWLTLSMPQPYLNIQKSAEYRACFHETKHDSGIAWLLSNLQGLFGHSIHSRVSWVVY